ncbi:MAG: hypothetical protein M3041_11755 [Acidobacteriota bacterium]|nr:hypothetical protein [Acidobacteriota bacterium]
MLALAMKGLMQWAWAFGREVAGEWGRDDVALMAGGVAFYAIFSIFPLLPDHGNGVDFRRTCFGSTAPRHLDRKVRHTANHCGDCRYRFDDRLRALIQRHHHFSAVLLIFGASAVFNHMRTGLNIVFNVPGGDEIGWLRLAVSSVVSIVMVVGVMIFLLISVADPLANEHRLVRKYREKYSTVTKIEIVCRDGRSSSPRSAPRSTFAPERKETRPFES